MCDINDEGSQKELELENVVDLQVVSENDDYMGGPLCGEAEFMLHMETGYAVCANEECYVMIENIYWVWED